MSLSDVRIFSLAPSFPRPPAFPPGAQVTEVERPSDDFMEAAAPDCYREARVASAANARRQLRRRMRNEPVTLTSSNPSASARSTTCHGAWPPSAGSGKTSWTVSSPPGVTCRANAA